ncbi:MAG: DUF126 domain-containing protein [Chloroflexi bacterium]|nr:DUF126 domain-containing protein [Anaerolineaceae bacterium]MCY4105790.1 DUF126 domain-containing protein [Chloroflexota bacterium]
MNSSFQAQVILPGAAAGQLLVLSEALSFWGGVDPRSGDIIDERHPQRGRNVAGRILALPKGRGSSSASSILLEACRRGTAPAAILTRELDGILALGAVVARELYDVRLPMFTLNATHYRQLRDGRWLRIRDDGWIVMSDGCGPAVTKG